MVSHTSQCTSPGACHCTASTHGQLVQAAPSPSVPGAHASLRRRGSSGRVITDIALSSSPFPSQRMQRHCSAGSVCMGWRPLRCTAGSALTTWGAPLHSTPGPAKPTGLLSVSHPARQDVKPTAQPVDDPQQRHRAWNSERKWRESTGDPGRTLPRRLLMTSSGDYISQEAQLWFLRNLVMILLSG